MQDVIRVLLNEKDKKLTLRELALKANVSLGMTAKIVGALGSAGQLERKRGIALKNFERLLKAFAYCASLEENKKIEFLAPERPQYLIKKIGNLLRNEDYAFTLFAATEVIAPYVAPDKVHLYILERDDKKISTMFVKEGIVPAGKGNIICYLVDKSHFYGTKEINKVKLISLPQLYADLISYSARGEEAAQYILNQLKVE